MDQAFLTIYVLFGFILRLGIPIGLTLALGWFLRRLDARWREEALQSKSVAYQLPLQKPVVRPLSVHCWQFFACPPELLVECPAYNDPDTPCWEIFRQNGDISKRCQICAYRFEKLLPAGAVHGM